MITLERALELTYYWSNETVGSGDTEKAKRMWERCYRVYWYLYYRRLRGSEPMLLAG